jgi:4-diphosphocytidyl-2-C-methyl-D-erythritol kinase
MIRELAPAKVNLFLHVGQKRPDGYHDIESLVVFASVGDELTVEEADELSLEVTGPFAPALKNEPDNLVLRATRKLAALVEMEPRVRITLTKNLPVASGIGGGSSDAGATLRALSRLWRGRANLQGLWDLGGEIGSDVSVSVLPGCWWMTGRGERFSSIPELGTMDGLLVNAGAPVSTADVYGALRERTGVGQFPQPQRFATIGDFADYLGQAKNDLEAPARKLCPAIGDTLDTLARTKAVFARMSGSGATCFALYPDSASAQMAADTVLREHPNWWVAPTRLNFGRKWEVQ